MVRTSAPSWLIASARQELTRRPSTMTVQAPHWPRSQPFLVPVNSRRSRSRSKRVTRGSSSWIVLRTPFTVRVVEKAMQCSVKAGKFARIGQHSRDSSTMYRCGSTRYTEGSSVFQGRKLDGWHEAIGEGEREDR